MDNAHIKDGRVCWCKDRVVFTQPPLFYIREDGEIFAEKESS